MGLGKDSFYLLPFSCRTARTARRKTHFVIPRSVDTIFNMQSLFIIKCLVKKRGVHLLSFCRMWNTAGQRCKTFMVEEELFFFFVCFFQQSVTKAWEPLRISPLNRWSHWSIEALWFTFRTFINFFLYSISISWLEYPICVFRIGKLLYEFVPKILRNRFA